ncbi:MAG TPA: putative Ig domain-containing protein [Terriglobales bacterium]
MTALKRALSLVICVLICGFALSCATARPPTPVLPLVIAKAALPTAVINVPYSATLTSTGGVGPFTWAMASGTLPPGLSISTAGVISGTPTVLGTTNFKVQVTDSQTPTAAVDIASESITVNSPLAVSTTSLTAGSINVPYSASLAATGGVPPYTWTVTSGSLPAGLTLSTSGFISGTPTSQQTSTFTVQASDSQTPPSTATATLSLTINGPTFRLNGNYVFSFSGYSQGKLVVQAGSFTSDGQGNITNGLMDSNSATGVHTQLPFTGTYSVDSTNTGPMTLVMPALGTFSYQLAVPVAGTIRFIQNGSAGNQGTGVIRPVATGTPVTISSLAATWAFGSSGGDFAANRYAAAGTFVASNTGAWTGGVEDTNDNGIVANSVAFTGSFVAIDPVTGRGTATLSVTNGATTNYSFYPVSSRELIMLGIDPVSSTAPLALLTLDTAFVPIGGFTNASLKTTTVAELQGVALSNGNPVPDVLLAFATFDGTGGLTVSTDENLGGTLSANKYTGTYNVETTGRTTLTGIGSSSIVFYLSSNVAFTVAGDASVTAGTFVPQFGSPFTNTSISGSYQGGTIVAVLPTVTVEADSANPDGNGNFPLTYDTSGPGGPQQGLTLTATYSVDSTGRSPLTVNGTTNGIAYVVSPSKVLVLSTDANPKVNSIEK